MRNQGAAKFARNAWLLHALAIWLPIGFCAFGQTPENPAAATPPNSNPSSQNQPAGNVAEMSTTDAPATFRSRVNLVMVPVVVRDRQGHAIGTLKKEDFQLFDKGKPQTISRFSVEKPGDRVAVSATPVPTGIEEGGALKPVPDASAIPTKFIAYLFDDMHLEFGDIAQARQAAAKYLTKSIQPTDRIAIYTTSGQGQLDFTDDVAKAVETMNRIQPRARGLPSASDCPEMTYYMADLIQNKSDPRALLVAELDAVQCMNLTQGPNGQPPLQEAEPFARSAASRALAYGEGDTRLALSVLKNVIRRMTASPGQRDIVLVSPGFYIPDEDRFEETELLDQAIRANVIISSLDARGLYVMTGGDVSQRTQNSATQVEKDQYRRDSDAIASTTLLDFSEGTGGTLFHNSNDLEGGFAQVSGAPEFVYLIGFSPQNLKLDGSFHALKVTLKDVKAVTSQSRRGYYAPKHENNPVEQAKEEIQEAVFSREELSDLPLEVQTQFFKSSDVQAKLSVLAKMDLRKLPFRKADGRNNDTLTIVSGVFDRNGNLINAVQKLITMHLRDETLTARAVGGIVMRSNFDLTRGSYVIRVVIRDSEGQMMAARNGVVEIP
jgi:VWFA-related protein